MTRVPTIRGCPEHPEEKRPGRGTVCVLAAALFLGCLLTRSAGAWSWEDSRYGNFLVRELRYLDSAARWLDGLEKTRRTREDRAEIAALRIDILLAQGKEKEASDALDRFKKSYPWHRRASTGGLDLINRSMGKVLALFDKAASTADPAKAASYRTQAKQAFQQEVQAPLDTLIGTLQAKIKQLKEDDRKEREKERKAGRRPKPGSAARPWDKFVQARDQAELSRLKAFLVYARRLEPASKERKDLLEKGMALAETYVEDRYEYFVMQYDGQLQRGIYNFELGRYDEADQQLRILYDVVPPGRPPFSEGLVTAFKLFRLQAVLFGARSMVKAGNNARAINIIETYYLGEKSGPFSFAGAEGDPALRKFAVLVRLEYGVALAAAGRSVEGLEQIQKVIARFSSAGPRGEGSEFVTEARRALARVAGLPGVKLRGQDLYPVGIGLKSERKFEEAVRSFQKALAELRPSRVDDRELMARCLNEIGEIQFLLGRYDESALAYEQVYLYFQDINDEALVKKVARNFLAATLRALETRKDSEHSALKAMEARATRFNEQKGSNLAGEELKMKRAQGFEDGDEYAKAREVYLQVPREVSGEKVPFYWRAQASAWLCTFKEWLGAQPDAQTALEPQVDKAVQALEKIVPEAIRDEDFSGAATAALGLGQIHFNFERWDEAVKALEVFTKELDRPEAKSYRCLGLGYLIMAYTRLGDCDAGRKHFLPLYKTCKVETATAYAAQALAECFFGADNPKRGAVYLLVYLRHPASAADRKDPQKLLQFAKLLIKGGRTKDAQNLVTAAKDAVKKSPSGKKELTRSLLVIQAEMLAQENKWNEVVATLLQYLKEYEARGDYYEDPYVRHDLAEAYISRSRRKPTFKDYQNAKMQYSAALAILKGRLQKDPKLEGTFYRWALRYCSLLMQIGNAGEPSAYGEILLVVDAYQHTKMGGLREEFLKLRAAAERKRSTIK